jgi:regulator of ribosome biosynthesis
MNEKLLADSVVQVDMGNLMSSDARPVDSSQFKIDQKEEYLKNLTIQTAQVLLAQLFQLPVERVEDVVVAKLPKPSTIIPREKPLPKQKPLTKWEQYAKLKGIQKKKKSKMVFDELNKEWKPRWGYKRGNDDTKNWIYEIKKNEDPYQDFFAKENEKKNERVAKNELKRLRNIARATKGPKVPGVGLTPLFNEKDKQPTDKLKLKRALQMANKADASMSKFSQKVENIEKVTKGLGKKRKFAPNFETKNEKEKQLKIFDKLSTTKDKSSKDKLKIDKAVNKHIAHENNEK